MRNWCNLRVAFLFLATSTLLLTACGDNTAAVSPNARNTPASSAGASGELVVYAASSLTDVFGEMKTSLEGANPGLRITFNFGGSNALRTQLEQGAKADIFASADQTQMDAVLKAGLVAGSGTIFSSNRLVVILPKNNPGKIQDLPDLAKPGLKFVVAQKDVPVGAYTLTALEKMGQSTAYGSDFKTKVEANTVSREANVRQVVSKVQLGEADAAIVYKSDVTPKIAPELTLLDIPDNFNTLAAYPIAPLKATANPAASKVFIDYVLSGPGQALLKKYNFIPVTN